MALSDSNKTAIAFKNLLGKSQTSTTKELGNEAETIKFVVSWDTIWVQDIPSVPVSGTSLMEAVTGTFNIDPTSNGRAYFLTYNSSHPLAGQRITGAISPQYGDGYEAKIIATDSTIISVNDSREWLYQYFSGVYFQQNSNATPAPASASLYVYTGQTLKTANYGSATGGGADISASYIVVSTTSSLPNERRLTGGNGVVIEDHPETTSINVESFHWIGDSDGTGSITSINTPYSTSIDPNGLYPLDYGTDIFFYVSGAKGVVGSLGRKSVFGGDVVVSGTLTSFNGFSGSLTKLTDGTSFIIAGTNITVTTGSNGAVTINSTATGGGGSGDPNATYLVLSNTASLSAERAFAVGPGLTSNDGGANGVYAISASLVAGPNITLNLLSNNSYAITASGDPAASYLVVGNTSSLSAERALAAGPGISFTDGGANSIFAISASTLAGPGIAINQVGNSYAFSASLLAGPNTIINQVGNSYAITSSNGSDIAASYLVVGNTSSLSAERSLVAGNGITFVDAGANSTFTIAGTSFQESGSGNLRTTSSLAIGTTTFATGSGSDIFFYVSGTIANNNPNAKKTVLAADVVVSGGLKAINGFSGSHTVLADGTNAFVAGPNVSISIQSNGAVAISGSTQADSAATYLVLSNTSSLSAERALTIGTGLSSSDGGANSSYTISANLLAGPNVNINAVGNAYAITASGDPAASYLVVGNTSSLSAERSVLAGNGITFVDGGANSTFTIRSTLFNESGSGHLATTSSVSIGTITYATGSGSDIFFYVSGTQNVTASNSKKAVFGGDTVISGNVQAQAGCFVKRTFVTGTYTVKVTDYILGISSSGAGFTITLPTASLFTSFPTSSAPIYMFADEVGSAGQSPVVINPAPGNTINGSGSMTLSFPYDHISIYWTGTNWYKA